MSGVAVIVVVAMVSVLAAVFIGAVVLNVREYQKVKGGHPIPVDLTDNLTLPEGLPWDRRFRGQPWPDPETGLRMLTAASAWRYAGASGGR